MRARHNRHVFLILAAFLAAALPARAAPQHVVSVFLCTDEYVFRLVPREHIAALSVLAGETHPAVSTIWDKVTGIPQIRPSAEAVLSLHPDLVVLYEGTEPRLRSHLIETGVKVLDVPWAKSLADVRKIALMLGARLGAEARARALLKEMDAKLAAARAAAPNPPVSTLVYAPNGYAAVDGAGAEIMRAAGLADAARALHPTRQGTLPVEAVITAAPELLILNALPEETPARADIALRHPALTALKGRTYIARAALTPLLCPGPWSADAAGPFAAMAVKARALAAARHAH